MRAYTHATETCGREWSEKGATQYPHLRMRVETVESKYFVLHFSTPEAVSLKVATRQTCLEYGCSKNDSYPRILSSQATAVAKLRTSAQNNHTLSITKSQNMRNARPISSCSSAALSRSTQNT